MKRAFLCTVVSLAIAGICGTRVLAQPRTARSPRRAELYEITSGIAEAMRHLAVDPDQTFRILYDLNARFPGRERILTQIGTAHQVVGHADSAEVYFTRALDINPGSVEAARALGKIYYGRGDVARGKRIFDRLIAANGESLSIYKVVGAALRELGRYSDALRVLEDGRRHDKRNAVLALDIASLRQQTGDLEGAIDEYLGYLSTQPHNSRFIRDRVVSVLGAAGDNDAAIVSYLEKRIATGDGNRYVMLDAMSVHFLKRGLLEKALETALRADKEKGSNGMVLLTLAEQVVHRAVDRPRAEKPRYLELGVRALDSFTRNHPRQPGTDRALFMLASIHVQFGTGVLPHVSATNSKGYIERAVGEYTDLVRRYPNSSFAPRAYLKRGDLLLYTLRRPDDALKVYRSGTVNSRMLGPVFAARIADVYLGTGNYTAARRYLDNMLTSSSPKLAQSAVYYTGLMLAFSNQFAAARDTLSYLAREAPASSYTNDAIEVAWVIEEALEYKSKALADYLRAMRAQMIGDTAVAMVHLEKIVAEPAYETLRPRALYRLGRLRFEAGQSAKALTALREFLKDYPDENLRPDVQRTIARVYEQGFGQYKRALQEYELVLVEYPDYAFLDEVRHDVRRLRGVVHGDSDAN